MRSPPRAHHSVTDTRAATAEGVSRKDAARAFFELLVLGSRGYVVADQPRPFADISISKADTFDGLFAVRAH